MWAPVAGLKPSAVFVQCPSENSRSGGALWGAVARRYKAVVDGTHRGDTEAKRGEESQQHEVFYAEIREGGQETED